MGGGGQRNNLLIFHSISFQRKKDFEKFQTNFKSLGSALPVAVKSDSVTANARVQNSFLRWYTLLSNKFAWKIPFYSICQ